MRTVIVSPAGTEPRTAYAVPGPSLKLSEAVVIASLASATVVANRNEPNSKELSVFFILASYMNISLAPLKLNLG